MTLIELSEFVKNFERPSARDRRPLSPLRRPGRRRRWRRRGAAEEEKDEFDVISHRGRREEDRRHQGGPCADLPGSQGEAKDLVDGAPSPSWRRSTRPPPRRRRPARGGRRQRRASRSPARAERGHQTMTWGGSRIRPTSVLVRRRTWSSPNRGGTVVRQGSGRPAIAVRPGGRRVVERRPTGGPAASWSVARAGWTWCPPRPAGGILDVTATGRSPCGACAERTLWVPGVTQ